MSYGIPGDQDYLNHIYGIVKKELKHKRKVALLGFLIGLFKGAMIVAVILAVGLVW